MEREANFSFLNFSISLYRNSSRWTVNQFRQQGSLLPSMNFASALAYFLPLSVRWASVKSAVASNFNYSRPTCGGHYLCFHLVNQSKQANGNHVVLSKFDVRPGWNSAGKILLVLQGTPECYGQRASFQHWSSGSVNRRNTQHNLAILEILSLLLMVTNGFVSLFVVHDSFSKVLQSHNWIHIYAQINAQTEYLCNPGR